MRAEPLPVEPASPRDLPGMMLLMRQLADEHAAMDEYFAPGEQWGSALEMMFLDRMGRRDHYLGVARRAGMVIGMITASLQSTPIFVLRPRAMIENVVVHRANRRQGVGRALVAAALAWCDDRGVCFAELMVAVGNPAGQRFWAACGFEPVMLRMQLRRDGAS